MLEKELLRAAKANRLQKVYALLRAYPTINVDFSEEEYKDTALIYAIENHNLEMAQVLLEAGADANWTTSDHNFPPKNCPFR